MKRISFILIAWFCLINASAQPPQFNPKQFEADLEQFITVNAGLTPQEAARFFPLFREMQDKQRLLFGKMRSYRHVDTNDDQASLKAIRECDNIDLQMKKIQQTYHIKFCKVLPAGKVLKIIHADEKFHRQAFKKAFHGKGRPPKVDNK